MPSVSRRYGIALVAVVLWRSLVWVLWEQSDFDSDQAVIGLMGIHLAEGRAFPVFMYGQTYLLAVEAWLAAPLFAIAGPSVVTLKLPIVAMNVAIVLLLFRTLWRDTGVKADHAFVACLLFAAAPPVAASRLAAAAGANIEPFVYALLLWIARGRPVVSGVIAGIGTTHREFTWYAVASLVALDAWTGSLFTRRRLREWGLMAASLAAMVLAIRQLAVFGDVLGPNTAGMPTDDLMGNPAARICVGASAWSDNLQSLFTRNVATLFGWRPELLRAYGVTRGVTVGHVWLLIPLAAAVVLAGGAAIAPAWRSRIRREDEVSASTARRGAFPVYLMLVGGQAAVVYAFVGCDVQDLTLIRYTLLVLFVPVGLIAWGLAQARSLTIRWSIVGAVLVWAAVSTWDTGRLVVEYWRRPPPDRVRQLVAHLDGQGVRFGNAPYWTAYVVDFLSNERIILASTEQVRIQEYRDRVDDADTAGQPVVDVSPEPCTLPGFNRIQGFCIRRRH